MPTRRRWSGRHWVTPSGGYGRSRPNCTVGPVRIQVAGSRMRSTSGRWRATLRRASMRSPPSRLVSQAVDLGRQSLLSSASRPDRSGALRTGTCEGNWKRHRWRATWQSRHRAPDQIGRVRVGSRGHSTSPGVWELRPVGRYLRRPHDPGEWREAGEGACERSDRRVVSDDSTSDSACQSACFGDLRGSCRPRCLTGTKASDGEALVKETQLLGPAEG